MLSIKLLKTLTLLAIPVAGLVAAALPAGLSPAAAQVAVPAVGPVTSAGPTADTTVYVANEASGTISVINAATNAVAATICLGSDPEDDLPGTPGAALLAGGAHGDVEADHHKPFYDGHVAPHGLWLTPDGATLLVTNRISGTIVAIDTAGCNGLVTAGCPAAILGYTPVGREPHLATVRPGGREAWVAVRGERYVDVLKLDRDDLTKPGLLPTARMERAGTVATLPGPSMVTFTSDGRHAFVAHGKAPVLQKVDAASRQVVASQTLPAPFTPFALVTPDDREVYLVHKGGRGTLSVLRTTDLGVEVQDLVVGQCANHVAFVGRLAYVTVGGPPPCAPAGAPDREGPLHVIDRASRSVVGPVTAPAGTWTGDPHGIWASSDGRRLYVGHESGNRVTVVDTGANPDDPRDDTVVATVTDPRMKQPVDLVTRR
jgi:YVTN family beta-propeller protein